MKIFSTKITGLLSMTTFLSTSYLSFETLAFSVLPMTSNARHSTPSFINTNIEIRNKFMTPRYATTEEDATAAVSKESREPVGKPGTAELDTPWEDLGFMFRPVKSHLRMTWKDGEWGKPELVEVCLTLNWRKFLHSARIMSEQHHFSIYYVCLGYTSISLRVIKFQFTLEQLLYITASHVLKVSRHSPMLMTLFIFSDQTRTQNGKCDFYSIKDKIER